MPEMFIVMTSAGTEDADPLAEKIIAEGLAACVQVLPPMTSVYVWKGEVHKDRESLLLIKTPSEQYERLETFIKANHPYETPELIAIDAEKVSDEYLSWARNAVRSPNGL